MGMRRQSRELALQFLFSQEFQDVLGVLRETEEGTEGFHHCLQLTDFSEGQGKASPKALKVLPYAEHLIAGVASFLAEIDALLTGHSHNWRIERMSLVDRNILRIAIYEMLHEEEIPAQVAINEALEIARRYSVEDSLPFINGILDSVHTRGQEGTTSIPSA